MVESQSGTFGKSLNNLWLDQYWIKHTMWKVFPFVAKCSKKSIDSRLFLHNFSAYFGQNIIKSLFKHLKLDQSCFRTYWSQKDHWTQCVIGENFECERARFCHCQKPWGHPLFILSPKKVLKNRRWKVTNFVWFQKLKSWLWKEKLTQLFS